MTDLAPDTVARLLEDRGSATPDATMVVDEHHRRATFGDVAGAVERTAAGLLARGVRPGEVVSWQLPNRIETITFALALARIGAVQNPLVTMLRERELGFICRQARARWLAVPAAFRGTDHEAMARTVAQSQPGLEVLLIDGDPPEGDPATSATATRAATSP